MKRIAFICGPQLGHVGRLYKIAMALRDRSDAEITFILPRSGRYAKAVFGDAFEVRVVTMPEDSEALEYEVFSDALAQLFDEIAFDLIVQDIGALNWLAATRFPQCPRVVVTNVFLTRVTKSETVQFRTLAQDKATVDRARSERGLAPLEDVFDLYEGDRVLLADPAPIVREFGELPPHYIGCGAVSWALEGPVPTELADKDNLLLASMGSTGRKDLKAKQIARLQKRFGCSYSVYVGDKYEKMRQEGVADFQYEWLPLESLLSRTKVVVSQGGAGSSYQALSGGRPVVTLPKHGNHDILGRIFETLGVGVCIEKGESMGAKLQAIDIDEMTRKARIFSDEMAREEGASLMAREIASLL